VQQLRQLGDRDPPRFVLNQPSAMAALFNARVGCLERMRSSSGQEEPQAAAPARRFPPPWSVDELEACFVVIDSAALKKQLNHC
jgi:hypothetical protein